MSLELLPQELLHLVTCHLSAKQYLRLYSTCKQLYGMRTPYNFKVTKLKRFLEKAPIPVLENYSFVGTKSDWVLMVACRRGAFQLVDRLLTSQEAQRTDYALPKQWTDEADELISITMGMKDYKPKSEHHTKVTLLHIAAIFDQQEICQLLLDRGADVDANCQKSCTPLLISLIKRNAQLSLFLLERGADPNGNGMDGRHILTEASSCGTPEILTKLIEGGAQLPEDDIPVFFSAAATNGSLEVVKWIFEQEQYRHMIGENALSIVHNAVSSPTPKMEYILAKLHEIVQHPYLKEEAMLYADEEESMHNVEWLLDQGALIDGPPDSRESLLANAARDGEVDLMEFLLDRGASMHIGNDQKDNPFLLAIMDNQLEACELLVERNPDI
ncbi:ankyrin repeat-containing domain protein, partial [Gorgonomyces haynaldii]